MAQHLPEICEICGYPEGADFTIPVSHAQIHAIMENNAICFMSENPNVPDLVVLSKDEYMSLALRSGDIVVQHDSAEAKPCPRNRLL